MGLIAWFKRMTCHHYIVDDDEGPVCLRCGKRWEPEPPLKAGALYDLRYCGERGNVTVRAFWTGRKRREALEFAVSDGSTIQIYPGQILSAERIVDPNWTPG